MAKGIIYVMSTVVPGLIKIGKTGIDNFETRMYSLEHNGYFNVVGLKREFAIEVEDYDEKEELLDDIFSKSRVPNSELFALDLDLVIQLLSSFEGVQVYPEKISKEDIFDEATAERDLRREDCSQIPNGTYYLMEKSNSYGVVKASMRVQEGSFIVQEGSNCLPLRQPNKWAPAVRKNAPIKNGILQADVTCQSPSTAGWIVLGYAKNGWKIWKDIGGNPIDIYRNKEK